MENQLQIFSNPEFGSIRTLGNWENPLFCLPDACKILDLDPSAVVRRLDDEVISSHPIADSLGRIQMTNFVNEDGLYDVILDSRKPEARRFRKWITCEVLPSIRKYGYYVLPNKEMYLYKYVMNLVEDAEEKAKVETYIPALSLQIQAMIKKFTADYQKTTEEKLPLVLDLPGEIWKWIKGYEGDYQASTFGRVRSFLRGKFKILKPTISPRGYLGICLYKKDGTRKTFRLNRIIAETFIQNPESKPEVHHLDNDKSNNAVWNLQWVTGEENREHAHKDGCYLKGEKNPSAKLTEDDVRFIREHYKANDPEFGNIALAEKFKVSDVTITNIVTFKTWKHVK